MQADVWDRVTMPDTRFTVAPEKRARLAQALPLDPLTAQPQSIYSYEHEAKFDCAGSCAFGTVGGYTREQTQSARISPLLPSFSHWR
ncbi:MAG: hypothetical protein V4508_21520 [Pseudomonadota bacterium]